MQLHQRFLVAVSAVIVTLAAISITVRAQAPCRAPLRFPTAVPPCMAP